MITISGSTESKPEDSYLDKDNTQSFLESRIGEFGLAWMGNLVLFFGIIFLSGYLNSQGMAVLSVLLGYTCVAIILILSSRIRRSLSHMGFTLYLNGHILLYYTTLKLHYLLVRDNF